MPPSRRPLSPLSCDLISDNPISRESRQIAEATYLPRLIVCIYSRAHLRLVPREYGGVASKGYPPQHSCPAWRRLWRPLSRRDLSAHGRPLRVAQNDQCNPAA